MHSYYKYKLSWERDNNFSFYHTDAWIAVIKNKESSTEAHVYLFDDGHVIVVYPNLSSLHYTSFEAASDHIKNIIDKIYPKGSA